MQRYYFHLRNSVGSIKDEEGQEFASLSSVRETAIASIRSIIRDEMARGALDLRGRVDVEDENGQTILSVPYTDAFDIRIGPPPGPGEGA